MWRNSFKEFLGLPAALPSYVLNRIFTPTALYCEHAEQVTRRKICYRFGEEAVSNNDDDGDDCFEEEINDEQESCSCTEHAQLAEEE